MPRCASCGANFRGTVCPYCDTEVQQTVSESADSPTVTIIHQTVIQPSAPLSESTPHYQSVRSASKKSRWLALALCFFFGFAGFHCFYVHKTGMGILYLFTFGLFGIDWVIDLVLIATGKYKDGNGFFLTD